MPPVVPTDRAALRVLREVPLMRRPSRRELEILRWINAGAELYEVGTTQYRVGGIAAVGPNDLVQRRVIENMRAAGWLAFTPRHAFLTLRGRDVAELSATVRAFAEAPR